MAVNKTELWEKLLIASGMRKDYTGTPEEIVKRAKRINAHRPIPKMKDAAFKISTVKIQGFPLVRMIHKDKKQKACLYIIGGGLVKAPKPSVVKQALKIAKESGVDLFIPYYPLCTDYPISKTYEMIHETYKYLLKKYDPEKVSVLGTSSGGNLGLGIPAYINHYHLDVPMPGLILAISPATCVHSDLEWEMMEILDKKDIMVPASFLKEAVEIFRHGDPDIPEFMFYLQEGDFTNCPKVHFMYGSDETLLALAPSLEAALEKYDVDYEMTVADGMYHIYPIYPVVKEAKEGWKQMVEILKDY